jgi:hypothetical protein
MISPSFLEDYFGRGILLVKKRLKHQIEMRSRTQMSLDASKRVLISSQYAKSLGKSNSFTPSLESTVQNKRSLSVVNQDV